MVKVSLDVDCLIVKRGLLYCLGVAVQTRNVDVGEHVRCYLRPQIRVESGQCDEISSREMRRLCMFLPEGVWP